RPTPEEPRIGSRHGPPSERDRHRSLPRVPSRPPPNGRDHPSGPPPTRPLAGVHPFMRDLCFQALPRFAQQPPFCWPQGLVCLRPARSLVQGPILCPRSPRSAPHPPTAPASTTPSPTILFSKTFPRESSRRYNPQ